MGELILIDRVTNMTSACGVVEKLDEKAGSFSERASFRYGDTEARGDIFEEFYYDPDSLSVLKYNPVSCTYTVGDEIPVSSASYNYPESFDIIVLRDSVAVTVRNKKITSIVPFAEYTYDGNVPVINGRGFEVLVSDDKDVNNLLEEYQQTTDETRHKFFEKHMKFDTYRKITIGK